MKRTILMLLLLISASAFAGDDMPLHKEYSLFADKTYEEGFNDGIAEALRSLVLNAGVEGDTP